MIGRMRCAFDLAEWAICEFCSVVYGAEEFVDADSGGAGCRHQYAVSLQHGEPQLSKAVVGLQGAVNLLLTACE